MTGREVEEFIEKCNRLGSKPGLDTIYQLLERLDNPQDKLPVIHIAGTNGKGSVLAYMGQVLKEGGYRVGRYISPTISDYRERFQINGRSISQKDLAEQIEKMKPLCDAMESEGFCHPTAFEMETALAFSYFVEKKCDVILLETGMGGTLDATNVVKKPLLCILASISMDHMEFLGDTLEKITAQKCGIIKEGVPVVSMVQQLEAQAVICKYCEEKKTTVSFLDKEKIKQIKYGLSKQSFSYDKVKYEITLLGKHQIWNAALALCGLKQIAEKFPVSEKNIQKGLQKTNWEGRFTILQKNPLFVIDGAHNADAAKKLMDSIDLYFTNRKIIYIMGMFKDKEYEKVIDITCRRASQIITVATPGNNRALPAYELAKAVSVVNPCVTAADSLEEAVEISYLFSDKETVIIAFGSLSFLGQLSHIVKMGKAVRSDTHGR